MKKKTLYIIGGVVLAVIVLFFFIFKGQISPNYVTIKYRDDKVNVADARFDHLDGSGSSFVKDAWYDGGNSYMIIDLSGTKYHYCGLPSSTWSALKQSSSLGSYYNSNIKGRYDCRINPVPSY